MKVRGFKVEIRTWCERHQRRCTHLVSETEQWLTRGLDGKDWEQDKPGRITWPIESTDSLGMAARRGGTIIRRCIA